MFFFKKNKKQTKFFYKGETMAAWAPSPSFAPSDLVKFKNSGQYIVLSVTSSLGFNKYHLMNIENGQQEMASAYEMEKIGKKLFGCPTEDEEFDKNTEIQPENRFKTLKEEEIDELAKKRTEPTTEKQTSWAIKILKGERAIGIVK